MAKIEAVYGLPFKARLVSMTMGQRLEKSLRKSNWMQVDLCSFGASMRNQVAGSAIASTFSDAIVFIAPDSSTSRDAVIENRGPIKGSNVDRNLLLRLALYGLRACWILLPSQVMFTVVPTPNISPAYYGSYAHVVSCLLSDESNHGNLRDLDVLIGRNRDSSGADNQQSMMITVNCYLATQLLGMDLADAVRSLRKHLAQKGITTSTLLNTHF